MITRGQREAIREIEPIIEKIIKNPNSKPESVANAKEIQRLIKEIFLDDQH